MDHGVTVFIPTYNRPEMLRRTLAFLHQGGSSLPVIVGDGSDSPIVASLNERTCRQFGENVEYFRNPPARDIDGALKNFLSRYNVALARVKTPYVACCADDELLITDTVVECAKFLADNNDYAACHGMYLSFRYADDAVQIDNMVYQEPSIDGNDVGGRLMQLYSNYEAPYYAVFRTEIQRRIIQSAQSIELAIMVETFHSAAAVSQGKIGRLDKIYYLRNVGVPRHVNAIESWNQWMVSDFDDFFERYREHRGRLINLISSGEVGDIDGQKLRRCIDMAFVLYLGWGFQLDYWIDEYLAGAVSDEDDRGRLRQKIAKKLSQAQPPPVAVGQTAVSFSQRLASIFGRKTSNQPPQNPPSQNQLTELTRGRRYTVQVSDRLRERFSKKEWDAVCRHF